MFTQKLHKLASFAFMLAVSSGIAQNDNLTNELPSLRDVDAYCVPVGESNGWHFLEDFIFAGIENLGSGAGLNGYSDFTNMQASVELGNTYILSVKVDEYVGNVTQVVHMWMDLNGNELFEANELLLQDAFVDDTLREYTVQIPNFAQAGISRIRVVQAWDYQNLWESPCSTAGLGEWEDYSVEIIGASSDLDALAVSLDFDPPIFAIGEVFPKAIVSNGGNNNVSFDVTCTIDGTSYSSTVSTPVLASGEFYQVTFDGWNADLVGVYNINVATALISDENPENDTFSGPVTIVETVPVKRIYGEEGTGSWCGWCPRGTVALDYMQQTYPDTFIGVAVHNSDPMTNQEWNDGLSFFSIPYVKTMRSLEDDLTIENIELQYNQSMSKTAIATCDISSLDIDEGNGIISFTVESTFVIDAENCRFSAAIIENNVTGSTTDYNQVNYYSGGANGPMGGYENLADPVPAADMVYNHVGRQIIGGFEGVFGSLPETLQANETYSYTFETQIDPTWDLSNIEAVGLLLEEHGTVINASKSSGTLGVDDYLTSSLNVSLYPNPASDQAVVTSVSDIQKVELYNNLGQLIKLIEGLSNTSLAINTAELQSGVYYVKVSSLDNSVIKKLLIE